MNTISFKKRPFFSRLLRVCLFAFTFLCIGLIGSTLLVAYTTPGRYILVRTISHLTKTPDFHLTFGKLSGNIFSQAQLDYLAVSDRNGTWLEAKDIHLNWTPSDLLSKHISLEKLSIKSILVSRKPERPQKVKKTLDENINDIELFLASPQSVSLKNISIQSLTILEPVLGQNAEFSGNFQVQKGLLPDTREQFIIAKVLRTDKRQEILDAKLLYDSETRTLDIDGTFRDSENGLLTAILKFNSLPEIAATVKGRAPVANWNGTLHISSPTEPLVSGHLNLESRNNTFQTHSNLQLSLASLMSASDRTHWQEPVYITIDSSYVLTSKIFATHFSTSAPQINITGNFERNFQSDYFLLKGQGQVDSSQVFSPFIPDNIRWQSATFDADILTSGENPKIQIAGRISKPVVNNISAQQGTLTLALSTTNSLAGTYPLSMDIILHELTNEQASSQQTQIPQDAQFSARGTLSLPTYDMKLPEIKFSFQDLKLHGSLNQSHKNFDGTVHISQGNLSALSFFLNQPISGTAEGTINFSGNLLQKKLFTKNNLQFSHIKTGHTSWDQMLENLRINGQWDFYNGKSIAFRNFDISSSVMELKLNGELTQNPSQLNGILILSDLSKVSEKLAGSGTVNLNISGPLTHPNAEIKLRLPKGTVNKRDFQNVTANVHLTNLLSPENGLLNITGDIEQKPLQASLSLQKNSQSIFLINIQNLAYQSISLKGTITHTRESLLDGYLDFNAGDLNDASPFLQEKLSGQAQAKIQFIDENSNPYIKIEGLLNNFSKNEIFLKKAVLDMTVYRPEQNTAFDGKLEWNGFKSGSLISEKTTLTASPLNNGTSLTLNSDVQGASLQAEAVLVLENLQKQMLTLQKLSLTKQSHNITLSAPVQIVYEDSSLTVGKTLLKSGIGAFSFNAHIGENIFIETEAYQFPLSVFQLFHPSIQTQGTLNARAHISGPKSRINGTYHASLSNTILEQNNRIRKPLSFNAIINGELNTASTHFTAAISKDASRISLSGNIPFSRELPLHVLANGNINLSILNEILGDGKTLKGVAQTNLKIAGSLHKPDIQGTVQIEHSAFSDPVNGLYFDSIDALITGSSDKLTLSRLSAKTRNGGWISGTGFINISPHEHFPASIQIEGKKARLVDSELLRMTTDLSLKINGPLTQGPTVSGFITSQEIQISIPDNLPLSYSQLPVRHINAPAYVIKRINQQKQQTQKETTLRANLDILFSVSNRIFIRGRGVNADLNGNVRILGSSQSPVFTGQFDLRRGTLLILGKKLDFKSGELHLFNSTMPELDFRAESAAGDVTVIVMVTGPATSPKFSFSSQPELPQDEILSRLLFGKPSGSLTAGQTIQLANAVAQLTGIDSLKMLDDLSQSLGFDSISLETDAQGNVGLGIGKRINDNVYLGFKQGSGQTPNKVTLDIDITNKIKVQGEAGDDGSTAVGIGMEWDY